MAKRKRLEVPAEGDRPVFETKPAMRPRMPIAEVAGEVAERASLDEVAREMTALRQEGRVVERIALDRIDVQHLKRDRMAFDEAEMADLVASIGARGQQTPIEVVRSGDRYGLISGLRRIEALRRLGAGEALALVRAPHDAADAHVAMVEENEIRAGLSFYERANVAALTAETGVFPDPETAIATLFARAPAARRSKIARFLVLRRHLGRSLAFPAAIPEKLGLALATALEADAKLGERLRDAFRKTPPADAEAERRVIERALSRAPARNDVAAEIAPDVSLKAGRGRVVLSGAAIDAAFVDALRAWVVSHAKRTNAKR